MNRRLHHGCHINLCYISTTFVDLCRYIFIVSFRPCNSGPKKPRSNQTSTIKQRGFTGGYSQQVFLSLISDRGDYHWHITDGFSCW